jgi:hypothetical protein
MLFALFGPFSSLLGPNAPEFYLTTGSLADITLLPFFRTAR